MDNKLKTMQNTFLQTLIGGKLEISQNECDIRLKHLGLSQMEPPFLIVEIAPNFGSVAFADKDETIIEYQQVVKQILKNHGFEFFCFVNSFNNFEILLLLGDINPRNLDEIFIKVHDKLYLGMGLELFIGIGSSVNEISKISKSAADAHLMLSYKYQYEDKGVINVNNLVKFQKKSNISSSIMLDRILGCFQDGNLGKMEVRLDELVDEIENTSNYSENVMKRALIEVTVRILNEASYAGVEVEEVLDGIDPYNWILQQGLVKNITSWIIKISSTLLSQMESKISHQEKDVIKTAKNFIENNISDTGLNLNMISEFVDLSSGYFSQLFKEETGTGFNNYVVNLRIDRAKTLLLETDLTQEEISKQSGFQSKSYFNRTFKKILGITPSEFRKLRP